MNTERNRIAMDLHDHVGAELTLVTSKLDVKTFNAKRKNEKEELTAISEQVRNINAILRETVWSIQNERITIEELLERVQTYVNKLFKKEDLIYRGVSNLPNYQLSPQIALNFYRILQECVTNCYKYSNAANLNIVVNVNNKVLKIKVKDDGSGFDTSIVGTGFGLKNMEQRCTQLMGEMNLKSSLSNGVQIEFHIPLK